MEGDRSWSVEAKIFELQIKGGDTGVRIFERSKQRMSSIFIRRDEVAWLVGALEEVAEAEKPVVFWDQSRAGHPRIITQKRSNRHGRFLSIEEFDGRRRSGIILIPEGRYGQGWARLMVELDGVNSYLWEGRKPRECKKAEAVHVRQRHTEVMGPLNHSEGKFSLECEDSAAKESVGLEVKATEHDILKKEGKRPVTYAQAVVCGSPLTHYVTQPRQASLEFAGSKQMWGSKKGVSDAGLKWAQTVSSQAEIPAGAARSVMKELSKRQEKAVSLAVINVNQDLRSIREWLGRLRGEVDAGIERLDEVLSKFKFAGSGQGSREVGRIIKPKRIFKPKQKYWARKKRWVPKLMGESTGCGPIEDELSLVPAKPVVVEYPRMGDVVAESMGAIGCLENLRRYTASDSTSMRMIGEQRRVADVLGALGSPSAASKGTRGAIGGSSGKLVQAAEGLGSKEEQVSSSPVADVVKDVLMAPENSRGLSGEVVGGFRKSLEVTKLASGPGCTVAVMAGPFLSEPKEAKPNRCTGDESGPSLEGPLVVSGSEQYREGSSPEIAQGTIAESDSGQLREGFSSEGVPETVQTGTEEAHRPGLGGQVTGEALGMSPVKSKVPGRGLSPEIPPETEQTGKLKAIRSGHGGQATGEVLGSAPSLPNVTGQGYLPEKPKLGGLPGILGAFVNVVEGEKIGVVTPLDKVDMSVILSVTQDLLAGKEDSPYAMDLKLALEDSGIAGLSCDGQLRELAGVLDQIIAKKYGNNGEHLSGLNVEDIHQVRGSIFVNDV
jgi:hypothetical protein